MKNLTTSVKQIILAIALVAMATAFVGCRNTAHGVGQDVERAGEKIQDTTN